MTGAEALLDVSGLSAQYGNAHALSDVSLTIEPGGVVLLLGRNGAGKSTLLGSISGASAARITGGRVKVMGEDVRRFSIGRRLRLGVAHVPEGRRIFAELTVRETLEVAAHLSGAGRSRAEIDRALELFPQLRERYMARGGLLSGGEQQMLAIARALVARPRLLLIDEASLGLAPVVIQQIYSALGELKAEGQSMLIVEQSPLAAAEVADHVCVMEQGEITLRTTPRILLSDESAMEAYL